MRSPFYITTPLYYVNARPHLGHAYTTIAADVSQRFNKMLGSDTFFTTGTDEHGDKIVKSAIKDQETPKKYADKISNLFKEMWPKLNIYVDRFIRTTDSSHISLVKKIIQRLYDSGDIYFNNYKGLYCFDCERFYNERELKNGKCPDHNVLPKTIQESNYFFKMSKYQEWLIQYIKKNHDFIRPERYKNEILSFLRDPLEDLCISRPKSRITWGIDIPFDENYVIYVWFDALLNYLSVLEYPNGENYNRYWNGVQHIIAKDILKPHGIYWPIILKASNIPIYNHLNVHGYWTINKEKMSKSLGNIVEPLSLKDTYGTDQFRFFLMREMVFGLDATFSEKNLVNRVNSDLANDLGNLFSRVISMSYKYTDGCVPSVDSNMELQLDKELESNFRETIEKFEEFMNVFAFHKGLLVVWKFISKMNKYIDVTSPWKLAKDKSAKKKLNIIIRNLLEGLRVIAGLISPVMPESAQKMKTCLGLSLDNDCFKMNKLKLWKYLKPGVKIHNISPIFPRIEIKNKQNKF